MNKKHYNAIKIGIANVIGLPVGMELDRSFFRLQECQDCHAVDAYATMGIIAEAYEKLA